MAEKILKSIKFPGLEDTYIIPEVAYNLLDNSYFKNPVNQRGKNSYVGKVTGIDKWTGNTAATLVSVEDGYIEIMKVPESTSTGTLVLIQYIDITTDNRGKTLTLAAKVKGGDVRLYFQDNTSPSYKTNDDWDVLVMTGVVPSDGDNFYVGLQGRNTADFMCEWIALYDGAYTAETLPQYIPKGYEVERMNCNDGASNVYTANLLQSGWSSSAPYTQSITVNGIFASDTPFIDLNLEGVSNGTDIIDAWSLVGRATVSANNTITAYCYEEAPTVDIPIMLKVVR